MDNQEKYDELYNIYTTLRDLADETVDEDYKESLQEIMWRAEDEMRDVEEILEEEERREAEIEMREREFEYRQAQGF